MRAALSGDVDVNARSDDNEWTALMVAAALDHVEVVEELLAQPGLDVNARGEDGRTALHVAAERGYDRIVALLVSNPGVDPNSKDDLGRTALALAAFDGSEETVARLLADPAVDPNLVDRDRQTALHWGALGGHADVVGALLADERTNPGIKSGPDGLTAYDAAEAAGRTEAAAVLEDRMRTDPGTDELSPGDSPPPKPKERPPFYEKPSVPETPGLRERRPEA